MKILARLLAAWEAPLTLAAWTFAFLYMLDQGRYKSFLRPGFGWLVVLGMLLLLAMLASYAFGESAQGEDVEKSRSGALKRLARLALLTLPLGFMMEANGSQLDVDAYRKRSAGLGVAGNVSQSAPQTAKKAAPEFLEAVSDPRAFEGERIQALGMISRASDAEKAFGPGTVVLFRFAVTCCAADARPVALAVRPEKPLSLKEGDWALVEGTIHAKKLDCAIVAVIDGASWKKEEAPSDPYLYP